MAKLLELHFRTPWFSREDLFRVRGGLLIYTTWPASSLLTAGYDQTNHSLRCHRPPDLLPRSHSFRPFISWWSISQLYPRRCVSRGGSHYSPKLVSIRSTADYHGSPFQQAYNGEDYDIYCRTLCAIHHYGQCERERGCGHNSHSYAQDLCWGWCYQS